MAINSSKKATLIFTAITVVVLGGFALILAKHESLIGVLSGANQSSNRNHPTSVAFDLDDQQLFAVKMHSDVRMDENGGAGSNGGIAKNISLELEGVLEIVTVAQSADLWQVLMRFSPGVKIDFVQDSHHHGDTELADTASDLRRGMMVALAKQGHIVDFSSSGNMDRFAEQLLKQVASGFQFNWAESASSRNWTQRELDGSGIYLADYHVDSENDGYIEATKTKTGYSTMAGSTNGGAAPALRGVLKGQVKFHLDYKSGWPRQIDGQESASVSVGELPQQMVSAATTSYSFRFLNRQRLTHANVMTWRQEVESPASKARDTKRDINHLKNYAKERLGETKLTDIQNEFGQLGGAGQKSSANQERLNYDRLVAYVRINDENLSALRDSLKGREAKDLWLLQSLSALAYVWCQECQSTLVDEIMSRTSDPDFASNLLSLLSQPQDPSPLIQEALRTLTKSSDSVVRSMAQLGLGTVSNKLKQSNQSRADLIANDFVGEFNRATTLDGKLVALAVLGNSGSSRVIDLASPLLKDSAESTRIAAVNALRNVSSPKASEAALSMLSDPSAQVRQNVVRVIAQQPKSQVSCEILARHVQDEPVASVRSALIRQLGEYYQTMPIAKAAIERLAKSDPDREVRVLAENTVIMYSSR